MVYHQQTISGVEQVKALVTRRHHELGRPIVVGVSGFGGSGKSTLVRSVLEGEPSMIRLRGDDFLDPARSHRRSANWDGVERIRLVTEVLDPFRQERESKFRRFDWGRRELGEFEPLPFGDVLLVDLIGLFHPEALDFLDVSIWVDVSLSVAQERGMQRDELLGRDFAWLWNEVWVPNEIDFERNFAPRDHADVLFLQ